MSSQYEELRDLAIDFVKLRDRVLRAKLYRTFQAMEEPGQMIGFESAFLLDGSPIPENYIKSRLSHVRESRK